jgi:hypothetical protein
MEKKDLFDKAMEERIGSNEPMYFPREKVVCNLEGKFGDGNDFPFMVDHFVPDNDRGSWKYFGWKMKEIKIENSPSPEINVRYVKEKELENIPQNYLIHFYVYEDIINKNK